MADFDLGFGVDAGTMNGAMTALYDKLYPNSFTGTKTVEFLGVTYVFSWNIHQAPTFILAPPQEGLSLLQNHLVKNALGYPRKVDRITELYTQELEGNVFQLLFQQVTFGIKAESSSGDVNVSMNIIIQANSAGGKLALIPLKAVAHCDNPTDQWVLDNLILPRAKEAVAEMLQGISLPNLQFSGLTLTPINMAIASQHMLGFTNIAGKSIPQPPFGDNWPNSPFFALISSDAKMTIRRAINFGSSPAEIILAK